MVSAFKIQVERVSGKLDQMSDCVDESLDVFGRIFNRLACEARR